jgi:hypothetical protein
MGQVTSDFQAKNGALNVDLLGGPTYSSPFTVHSILYKREKTETINIIVEIAAGGRTFILDRVLGTGETYYVLPNPRVPYKISLANGCKLRIRTENVTAGDEKQSVVINWSDFT